MHQTTSFAQPPITPRNRILSALPDEDYARLAPRLEYVEMPLGEILYRPTEIIRHVYFPFTGTISLTSVMADGAETEVGIVGREGALGLPLLLGDESVPLKAVVQVAGTGARIRSEVFKEEINRCGHLQRLLLKYAQAFFVQTAQTAACNRLHTLDRRLACWLLTARDRAQTNALPLTHEFISVMLGVRRAGVTEALGAFHRGGLIDRARGRVSIIDPAGLGAVSCECYAMVRDEYNRVLGGQARPTEPAPFQPASLGA
ncbi:MAG: Crp/Fnr family transcriptional regulator [Acidobacteria bacterium]|nr:Crp/Fnr family transcriptional regulator [Acidobacteriota bacterium]